MPPNPKDVDARIKLSQDYHNKALWLYEYTNGTAALSRGDIDEPDTMNVWFDRFEKRALLYALVEEYHEDGGD